MLDSGDGVQQIRDGGWGMAVEKVSELRGGKVIECFVGDVCTTSDIGQGTSGAVGGQG